jgi:hypothetical protein
MSAFGVEDHRISKAAKNDHKSVPFNAAIGAGMGAYGGHLVSATRREILGKPSGWPTRVVGGRKGPESLKAIRLRPPGGAKTVGAAAIGALTGLSTVGENRANRRRSEARAARKTAVKKSAGTPEENTMTMTAFGVDDSRISKALPPKVGRLIARGADKVANTDNKKLGFATLGAGGAAVGTGAFVGSKKIRRNTAGDGG